MMVNLVTLTERLNDLIAECQQRGLPMSTVARIKALQEVLPNVEHARQAQDRTNG